MSTNTNAIEITVKSTISFTEYKAVCNQVVNACFSNGEYSPEFLDIMEQYYTTIAYTDYDFGIENITKDNIEKAESLVEKIEAEGKENAGSRFTIILPEKQTGINIV